MDFMIYENLSVCVMTAWAMQSMSQIKMRNCAGERQIWFSEHNPAPLSSQGNHKFSATRIIEFSAHERVLQSAIKDILLSLSLLS